MPLGLALIMGLGHNVAASGGGGGGPTAYRAFKLNVTRNASHADDFLQLAEFEGSTSAAGSNFLLGAAATATSEDFGSTAAAVFDGLTAPGSGGLTMVISSYPVWVIGDLGASSANWKVPFEFRLLNWDAQGGRAPGDFTIQATQGDPAGSPAWTTLVTVSGSVTGDWTGVFRTFAV